MIEITHLRVEKNGTTICSIPELSIQPGERVGIIGGNGSGKTTLLRVLAGLEQNFAGRCALGVNRQERVYVHQNPYLFRGTVLFNVTYGLRARGTQGTAARQTAQSWLDKLGIRELAGRRVSRLSGGEKRRVALARAMVLKPRLLLLDEPFAEMDDEGTARVANLVSELPETTILFASPVQLPTGLTTRQHGLS